GPTGEELERQKTKIEYGMISGLQSILGKANQLNTYEFFFGEPDSFKRDLDRYRHATPDVVRQWARRVFTPDARLILRVVPEGQPPADNPRDEQPSIAGAAPFSPLMPHTFKLQNGVTVHHWERHELPLVQMRMLIPYGTTSDPPDKAGLAALTADMLDEGAGSRGAVAFADALDMLGAGFSARSGYDSTTVSLTSLTRHFPAALALYADAVQTPRFDEKEWQRVHRLHLQRLIRLKDRPTYVAQTVAMRAFFGDDHPISRPGGGTESTAKIVTLDDVRRFHRRLYRPSKAVILIAGDLSKGEAKSQLTRWLGSWSAPPGVAALEEPSYPPPDNDSLRVVLVDRPQAVQTVVRFTMPGPRYADPNRIPLHLFNTILGGSFTSRLNKNLREDHGYTYGARCNYAMGTSVGFFTASSNVRADVTGASLGEFLKEFAAIRTGNISEEEARKARSAQRMRMIRSFAGLGGILSSAATLVRNGRPFSDLGDELQAVDRIGEGNLNRLAYRAVPLDKGLLVLVGDKALILDQLKEVDLPAAVELSPSGDPIR
ncbi:MAG: insulinase family protein, partial [Phycisphaerae bacterium]